MPATRQFRIDLCTRKYFCRASNVARCVVTENHARANAIPNSCVESVHWLTIAATKIARPVASCWSLSERIKRVTASSRCARLSFGRECSVTCCACFFRLSRLFQSDQRRLVLWRRRFDFDCLSHVWKAEITARSVSLKYSSGRESEK